jgi:hypothetical protein
VLSTQLGNFIFWAISQLNASPSIYGALDPTSADPSSHVLVETETCVAASYTMIARAAGDTSATIGDFYNAGSDPTKPHGADPTKLGPLGVQLSSQHLGLNASVINLLNAGHPVMIGGTFSANTKGIGRYAFRTIMPGLYPGRTRHYHVKVQAPSRPVLTTQFYFPGEKENLADEFFHDELVMQVAAADDALRARFDVVLAIR